MLIGACTQKRKLNNATHPTNIRWDDGGVRAEIGLKRADLPAPRYQSGDGRHRDRYKNPERYPNHGRQKERVHRGIQQSHHLRAEENRRTGELVPGEDEGHMGERI